MSFAANTALARVAWAFSSFVTSRTTRSVSTASTTLFHAARDRALHIVEGSSRPSVAGAADDFFQRGRLEWLPAAGALAPLTLGGNGG